MQQNKIVMWVIIGVTLLVLVVSAVGHSLTQTKTPGLVSKTQRTQQNPPTASQTVAQKVSVSKFPIWKTVTVGTYKTVEELKATLKIHSINYFGMAQELIESPSFSLVKTPVQIDLINISAAELGFLEPTTIKDVWNRAFEVGLSLCPQEVGAQLLLQHGNDTTENGLAYEYPLAIATQPISTPRDKQGIFNIGHTEGGSLILGNQGTCIEQPPEGFSCVSTVVPEDRFIFMRTK